jgi:hypothetical protein
MGGPVGLGSGNLLSRLFGSIQVQIGASKPLFAPAVVEVSLDIRKNRWEKNYVLYRTPADNARRL